MEQIGSVDEYFSDFVHCVQSLDLNDSEILKRLLNGLQTFIHRDIIFDDPQTLWHAFCLAKFYEEKWMNPFSETSKPQSQIQIQIKKRSAKFLESSSAKFPEATTISDSKQQEVTDSIHISEIQKLHIQITNSNSRNSSILGPTQTTPETVLENYDAASVHNSIQRQFENSKNKEEEEPDPKSRIQFQQQFHQHQHKNSSKISKEDEVTEQIEGDGVKSSGASCSAEVGAFAKGKVDADLEPAETEDDATASDADEATALSRCSVVGDSVATKRERTLKTAGGVDHLSEPEAKHQGTIGNCWYSAERKLLSGSGSAEDGAGATVTDGGLLTRRLRRFVSLTPPPILAAVFPWNRGGDGEEHSRSGLGQRAESSAGDEKTSVTMAQPRSLAERCLSLSSFGNGTNGRKEGFLAVAAGTSARPQASDGRCCLGPAVGDSAAAHGWWKHEVQGVFLLFRLQNEKEQGNPDMELGCYYVIQAQINFLQFRREKGASFESSAPVMFVRSRVNTLRELKQLILSQLGAEGGWEIGHLEYRFQAITAEDRLEYRPSWISEDNPCTDDV
ncbi:hypothetical protein PIB30_001502 [Stylosanthes scabra]|uniref:Uncharacterized protein n=1 Tax=Stylosanthes scabra TaxID=79078 RepID=A0ABU6Q3W3_9FABA|nr:hypothetical protein [Stylosanthes scabra]